MHGAALAHGVPTVPALHAPTSATCLDVNFHRVRSGESSAGLVLATHNAPAFSMCTRHRRAISPRNSPEIIFSNLCDVGRADAASSSSSMGVICGVHAVSYVSDRRASTVTCSAVTHRQHLGAAARPEPAPLRVDDDDAVVAVPAVHVGRPLHVARVGSGAWYVAHTTSVRRAAHTTPAARAGRAREHNVFPTHQG